MRMCVFNAKSEWPASGPRVAREWPASGPRVARAKWQETLKIWRLSQRDGAAGLRVQSGKTNRVKNYSAYTTTSHNTKNNKCEYDHNPQDKNNSANTSLTRRMNSKGVKAENETTAEKTSCIYFPP